MHRGRGGNNQPRGGGGVRRGGGGGARGNNSSVRDRRYNIRVVDGANVVTPNNASGDVAAPVSSTGTSTSNTSVKSTGPRNRRAAASVPPAVSQDKKQPPTPAPAPVTVKLVDDDPDWMYRSKIPKDPKYGHGVRYNPADPNAKIPVTKIYVSRFGNANITKLEELFSQYGQVKESVMKVETCYSYAFITFEHHKDALRALGSETCLGQRKLEVREAHDKHQPIPTHIDKLAAITAPNACHVDKLNDDCIRDIFSYLNLVTRTKIEVVCKRWHRISRSMWLVVRDLNFTRAPLSTFLDEASSQYDFTARQLISYTGHNLQSLTLRRFQNTTKTLKEIRNQCKCLERLSLVHFNFFDEEVIVPSVTSLKHLTLDSCQISDKLLTKALAKAKSLDSINLVRHLSGSGCLVLLNNIHSLTITHSEISHDHFEKFLKRNGSKLKSLSLVKCRLDQEMYESAVEKMVTLAPHIEVLKLDRYCPETLTLTTLYKLANLRSLSLCRNIGVTGEALLKITRNCKKLESVTLDSCTGLTPAAIEGLGKLPKLTHLSMIHVKDGLSNEAFIGLVNNLSSPNLLQTVLIANTLLSDEALYALLTLCPGLSMLDIAFCRHVTEATLMTAEDCVTSRTQRPLTLTMRIDNTHIKTAVQQASAAGKKFNPRLILKQSTIDLLSEVLSLDSVNSIYDLDTEDDGSDMSGDDGDGLLDVLNLVDSDEEYMYLMGLGIDGIQFGYDGDDDDNDFGFRMAHVDLDSEDDDSDPDYYVPDY
ncbi:hypothetical protein WDU94_010304 [Cyamophila willieti]